ncbi:MAG: hypothetical protein ABI649_08215 [Gaiellaceae bacterium]
MRGLLALVALVLALTAAACGGSGAGSSDSSSASSTTPAGETSSSESAQSLVAAAGAKTSEAESARISFTATFTGATSGSMDGEGVFAQRRGHLTMDMSALIGTASGPGQAEIIFDKLVYYMKLPASAGAPLPPGKEWFKIDLAKLGETQGLDLEQLTQLNQSDPSQALDFLRGASSDFREVGTEQVRGEDTTHYAGTIDLDKVAADAPPDVAEQYRKVAELSPSKKVPMEVWVGDDGLVRRIRFKQTLPGGSTMMMDEELYDYGTSADVSAPPEDTVVDLTALMGQS